MLPRILFIDDDINILQGLKRTLRPVRSRWEMSFVSSGAEGMKLANIGQFHVLVTDLCMPNMSGIEVLKHFIENYPETIRIVLSGQTDKDAFWQALGLAHLFISKPCPGQILEAIISRTLDARFEVPHHKLRKIIKQLQFIPFQPEFLLSISEELNRKSPNMDHITAIVEGDIGLLAKVIQIANTAYLGTNTFIEDAKKATSFLEIDGVKSLIASYKDRLNIGNIHLSNDLLHGINRRCGFSAALANKISKSLGFDIALSEKASLIGLLGGVGPIVLMSSFPDEYSQVLKMIYQDGVDDKKAEEILFNYTHSSLTSYLLNLWGIPVDICNIIKYLDAPHESDGSDLDLLTVLHVSDSITKQLAKQKTKILVNDFDMIYLEKVGCEDLLSEWIEMGMELFETQGFFPGPNLS